jgi:hypothetical protein
MGIGHKAGEDHDAAPGLAIRWRWHLGDHAIFDITGSTNATFCQSSSIGWDWGSVPRCEGQHIIPTSRTSGEHLSSQRCREDLPGVHEHVAFRTHEEDAALEEECFGEEGDAEGNVDEDGSAAGEDIVGL